MKKFRFLICGGTFDLLHKGHKQFLKKALESADKVLIGITSNEYVQSFKNKIETEDFNIRRKAVEDCLISIGAFERVQIISIDNAYEPNLETSASYDSILATKQTQESALEINSKRKQNGLQELEVITISMTLAEDGLEISSTRIRNGEINRNGRLCLNREWENKTLVLPENLRSVLQSPWGDVLSGIPNNIDGSRAIAVGDETVKRFNQQNVNQLLSIIDFLIKRETKFKDLSELGFANEDARKIKNLHGTIAPELFTVIKKSLKSEKRQVILIEGEDDLSALATLLIAPLGFSIFYGQPDKGLVEIKVSEETKEKAFKLVSQFQMI